MSIDEYLERFSNKKTEELVFLKVKGGLLEEAETALDLVLKDRNPGPEVYAHIKNVIELEKNEWDKPKLVLKDISWRFLRRGILLLVIVILIALYDWYNKEEKIDFTGFMSFGSFFEIS